MNDIDRTELVDAMTEALTKVWEVRAVPWDHFVEELLSTYRDGLRAPATFREMRHNLGLLSGLTAETDDGEPVPLVRSTADLTVATVARFVKSLPDGMSPHTVRKLLRSIRVAANIAVKTRKLEVSPFAIRNLASWVRAGKPSGRRHLALLELATLLGSMRRAATEAPPGWRRYKAQRIHAMAAVVSYAGLRAGELYWLDAADFDLEGRMIHVRPKPNHRLKTETSAAPVPMPRALTRIVRAWLEVRLTPPTFPPGEEVPWMWPGARGGGPWTGGPPGHKPLDVLQAAAEKAGVGHVSWQILRRSLTVHLRAFGCPSGVASRVLRHTAGVDELWYNESDLDNLRNAVADFDLESPDGDS